MAGTDPGSGIVGGLETCDDGNRVSGDGCSSTCQVEPFYGCTDPASPPSAPSVCTPAVQWVAVHAFTVSNVSPEAVHYDPQTRSFVGYKQSGGAINPIELCLDGSLINPNTNQICNPLGVCTTQTPALVPRPEPVSGKLEGATYDPFSGYWLFIQDLANAPTITRVSLDYATETSDVVAASLNLTIAAALSVGEDGRLYVADGQTSGDKQQILVFDRDPTKPTGFDLRSVEEIVHQSVQAVGDPAQHLVGSDGR